MTMDAENHQPKPRRILRPHSDNHCRVGERCVSEFGIGAHSNGLSVAVKPQLAGSHMAIASGLPRWHDARHDA